MRILSSLCTFLDFLLRRSQVEEEMEQEFCVHLRSRADDLERQELSRAEAERQARVEFGGYQRYKEECREALGTRLLGELVADARYGLRQLRRSPGFTIVAVLALALGIGANTAIFSLIDAVLLKALPVENPQQLVLLNWTSHGHSHEIMSNITGNVYRDKSGRWASTSFPYPVYQQIHAHNKVFSSAAALAANGSKLNVEYKGQPSRADGELVSGTFFSTLQVHTVPGRILTADDDRTAASPAAVIAYDYWVRRFGSDAGIVGQTITINGIPFTIVGVAPPGFYGIQPGRAVEVWLPLHSEPQVEPLWGNLLEAPGTWWTLIVGRLKPDITEEEARADPEVLLQQSIAPDVKPNTEPKVIPHVGVESISKGLNDLRSEFSKPLYILMVIVGLVLLIACANVANLVLARATTRQKEIAVRLALGGGRGRLIRQLLTESILLATLGGVVGLLWAFWVTNLLVTFMASGRESLSLNVAPDLRVLAFTAAASLLTGIFFGLWPALQSTRIDLTPTLKESPGELLPWSARRDWRLDKALLVTQVSLSLVLLIGAIQFVRTLTNLENVNLGFNQHHLLLFGIDPTQDGYTGQHVTDFYQELARRIEALPGVRSVGLSENTLIGGGASFLGTKIEGYTSTTSAERNGGVGAFYNWAGPRFFETMEIPLILGRTLQGSDTQARPKVAVVNKEFVREFLGGSNPIGQRFSVGSRTNIEIVGVVGNAKFTSMAAETPPTVYLPYLQHVGDLNPMHFEVRTAGNPMEIVDAVRRVAQSMDPRLAIYDVRSQTEQIDQTMFQERLFARLTGFFGALATLLACVGIYGVMAFAVTRRTREVGVRMALGASRSEIVGMILRETFVLVGIGGALGIVAALAASRLISTMLYGLKPNDPLTIAASTLLMLAAAALAGYMPARRAAKMDPMVALRYE